MMFLNRADAGRQLAAKLSHYKGQDVVVFALPRGGVVPGADVARELHAPLDLILVRKIGHPLSPEYAVGAVTSEGDIVTNVAETSTLGNDWLAAESERQLQEANRRRRLFLGNRKPVDVHNKVAIIVDDGIATGLTIEAAIQQLRKRHPARIVVAAPVAAADTVEQLRSLADDVVVVHIPQGFFGAIGAFYRNFEQLTDEQVVEVMASQPDLS